MFKKILVPTDGSKLSEKAVREAVGLARLAGGEVVALHVYPRYPGSPYGTFGPADDVMEEAHEQSAQQYAERLFAGVRKQAEAAKVKFEGVLVRNNDVWKSIVAVSTKKRCDVVCMASHGRKGLAGLVLGSETTKVLTHCTVPVLVVR